MPGFFPPPTAPSLHHRHTAPRRSPGGVDDSAGHRLFGGTDHSADAQQNTRYRGLRRMHTVIGSPSRPPPAPFQRAIDLSRSISPAPTMPPVTALWDAPATTPADQESPASRRQPTTEPFKNLREAFLICSSNQQQQAATPTDPFATPPLLRSPSPPRLSPSPTLLLDEADLTAFVPAAAPPSPPSPPSPRATSPFAPVPGAFPPAESSAVDSCVAHLIEMGYADSAIDGMSQVERLRIYAQIAEGDLDTALQLIEEEERAISELRAPF